MPIISRVRCINEPDTNLQSAGKVRNAAARIKNSHRKLPLHQMVRGPRNSMPPFWSILKSEREEKGLKKLPREIVPPAVTLEEKRLQRRMNVHIGQRRVTMKPANGFVHDLTPF
ncbi:hypothetical protein IIA29_11645 [candidate division KSB1 bacterium]|nr:hypothetical protein [candidate division KSB1 bacterium]